MKIVVTGGNGYIGARLCNDLADAGNQVIPVCNNLNRFNNFWNEKMFQIIEGDLRKVETIDKIVSINADVIIHLVSLNHFDSEKEPNYVSEINVLPTWNLLEKCTRNGLKRFIYLSTTQVYGKLLENSYVEENNECKPANAYGLTHLLSEKICSYYNDKYETDVIVIRLSNSYGSPVFEENKCWWLAINELCKNAFINKEIRLQSDGTPQRDFIHGNDVCKAIELLVNRKIKIGDNIFNLSSANSYSLLQIAIVIREVFSLRYGIELPIYTSLGLYKDKSPQTIFKGNITISNEKIKKNGFVPKTSITQGINDLLDYMERQFKTT